MLVGSIQLQKELFSSPSDFEKLLLNLCLNSNKPLFALGFIIALSIHELIHLHSVFPSLLEPKLASQPSLITLFLFFRFWAFLFFTFSDFSS